MGELSERPTVDINTVPYDAPLSISEPSLTWFLSHFLKGLNGTRASIPSADLTGKWIIISGANNGIGRSAALQFAKWGANMILACRPTPPVTETAPATVVSSCLAAARDAGHPSSSIEWWPLECSSLSSVSAFAARWLATGNPLDILCNNAGIGSTPAGSLVFKTDDDFELIHQVNFLSHVLLTLHLLPSLAKAPSPRIICTTSCMHYAGHFDLANFNGALGRTHTFYANNKLWFQIWLSELQRRMLLTAEYAHVTIAGVHPGCVDSGIWNLDSAPSWSTPLRNAGIRVLAWFMAIDTQQGSLAILHAATTEDGRAGGGARYFNRIWEETPMPHTQDPDCRQRVWRKVNDELKLEEKGLLDVLGLKYVNEL